MSRAWKGHKSRGLQGLLAAMLALGTVMVQAPPAAVYAAESGFTTVRESGFPVGPGVQHRSLTLTDGVHTEAVNLLEIDPQNPEVKLEVTSPKGKVIALDTVRNQAAAIDRPEHRVIAGFNMDFFNTDPTYAGQPNGLQISNGEVVTAAAKTSASILTVQTDGSARIINSAAMNATISLPPAGVSRAFTALNKPRTAAATNHLYLYNARYSASTKSAGTGVEIVLTPASGTKFLPNQPLTATVDSVLTTTNTSIPADKWVLSASGTQADWAKQYLTPGAAVQVDISFDQNLNATAQAVSGSTQLVANGQATPAALNDNVDRHPRTFVATKQGRLYVATFDGRQPTYSDGVTLAEGAKYLASLGMDTAMNVDGGGSTTYLARTPGDSGLTLLNRPSDGFERAVSNALMVVSTAPTTELAHLVAEPQGPVRVLSGGTVNFVAKGQDKSYNPVTVDPASLQWQADAGIGTISAQGALTAATSPATGNVTVSAGSISQKVAVEVVTQVARLALTPSPAIINPSSTQTFTATAYDAAGNEVLIAPRQLTWAVQGDIGTISADGVLTTPASTASGKVIVSCGTAQASADVNVGKPPVILEDFEELSDLSTSSARANSVQLVLTSRSNPVRFGTHSAKLAYDFTNQTGTSAAYINFKDANGVVGRPIEGRPMQLGIWVYGDSKNHWLRGQYEDGNGTKKTLDFTAAGGLNWTGWKYIAANVPTDAVLPLKFRQLYVVETSVANKNSGAVYVDNLRAVYSDTGEDLTGPVFSNMTPAPNQKIYTAQPDLFAVVTDAGQGVDAGSLKMTLDGQAVDHQYDAATGKIAFRPTAPLADGKHTVIIDGVDKAGNPALPRAEWSFTVYTGPDQDAPAVQVIAPLDGTTTRTDKPRLAVKAADDYTGIDPAKSTLEIDGTRVPHEYDPASRTLFYTLDTAQAEGSQHTAKVTVADKNNNQATQSWSFRIGTPLGQPQDPNKFQISVIGDGGYYTAGSGQTAADILLREQIARINEEPSELIGYTGDIVENDTAANYERAVQNMNLFKAPYIVSIGNHEISGTNSRQNYQQTFGEPTYTYDYGNTRIIGLDSASGRLSNSDASQWPWLESVLADNTAPNIAIIMHVPPDEVSAAGVDFNTGHGFKDPAEAQRFYDLLGAYKAAHPEKNIVVLSGDLHAYHHKQVQGVDYIISGGGGKYTHIPADQGGFFHYVNLKIDGAKMTWDVVPLLEAIAFQNPPATLQVNEQAQLSASGKFMTSTNDPITLPVGAPFKTEWSSSDPGVVTVDEQGKVTAKSAGEAVITVKSGWRQASATITVPTALVSDLSDTAPANQKVAYHLYTSAVQADSGKTVNLKVTRLDEDKKHFTLRYVDHDGKSHPLTFDKQNVAWLKDTSGYPLQKETTDFELFFPQTGTFSYKIELVDLATGETLAQETKTVTVTK